MPSDLILSAKVELHQPSTSSLAIDARIQKSRASLFSVLIIDRDNGFVGWLVVLGLYLNFPRFFFREKYRLLLFLFSGWLVD